MAPTPVRYGLTATQQELAQWLLRQEGAKVHGSGKPLGPTQQVLRRLAPGVTALVTAAGYRALLARALHLTKAQFPFLEGVHLSNTDTFIEAPGLARGNPVQVSLAEFVGHLIALLATFIGDELTNNLIQSAWPDAPLQRTEPGSGGKP